YDVDGSTLKLMNNVERISVIIPKFKQQLLFLEEREKLFRTDVALIELDGSSTSITTTQSSSIITIPRSSSFSTSTSQSSSFNTSTSQSSSFNTSTSQSFTATATNSPISIFTNESSMDCLSKSPTNIFTPDRYNNDTNIHQLFTDQYNIPSLPNNLIKDIEDGDMIKFGPHFSNRQILIDAVSYDLINNYKLFYPSPKQFDQIGSAIVKFLRLPLTKNNITVWKDALQTKLKRKRSEHSDNSIVQDYRSKYSRAGSGRPVKRRINEVAQRDRFKQLMVIPYNDHIANNIEEKINQLQDVSEIDAETRLKLWKETFSCRREYVRNQSTSDIVQKFPGYADSFLIFEEVKMLLQIDLAAAIRRQTSVILNKIVSSPVFITDSPVIQLIKTLCKEFGETIHHLFSTSEPTTPYPTMVCINDIIHIYVDFNSIVSTNSADDAVALLIAMYTIFELAFDKKSRTIRLLYAILHAETRYLTNSVRILIKEKNIDVYAEQQYQQQQQQQHQTMSNSSSTSSTIPESESQSYIQFEIHSPGDLSVQDNGLIMNQLTDTTSTNDNPDTNSNASLDIDENINIPEKKSSSHSKSQPQVKQRKRRRKNSASDYQNSTGSNIVKTTDDQIATTNFTPLNDLTNSSFNSRPKRQRRS
ncbi:unnamed protein product, partial [Adineta steineri]